jgi:plastocyanin
MEPQRAQSTPRDGSAFLGSSGLFLAIFVIFVIFVAFVPFVVPSPALRGAAATGAIRGRVDLRRPLPSTDRRPNVSDLGAGGRRDTFDRTKSVVYLETGPRGAFEQPESGHAVMNQRNETFVPHVLAVTTGSTVDFPNSDRIYHNVFSLSKPAPFDLGRYAAGHSKSVRFDRPGIVRVFCEIHSHMSAFILVFGHPFFTMTDADGRYRLDNIPPGAYSVVVWNEGAASDPAPVTVPNGGTAELDLQVR